MAKNAEFTGETLRAKSEEELKGMILDMKKEQFNLRFQATVGDMMNVNRLRALRKGLARVQTTLNQKKTAPAAVAAPARATKKKKG